MHDLIRRIAHWVSLLFPPGTGTHRAGAVPSRAAAAVAASSRPRPAALPAHRSPYGLDLAIDADVIPLVRPYLVAHEQECVRQRRRRLTLVLAAELAETEKVAA